MEENRKKVREALKQKKIDIAVQTKWPFIGAFMRFLDQRGVMGELKKIQGKQKRKTLGNHIFTMLYIFKLMIGIPHIRGTEELLGDKGVMKMLGFTQEHMENGLCNRGDANQYGKDYKKNTMRHGLVYNS